MRSLCVLIVVTLVLGVVMSPGAGADPALSSEALTARGIDVWIHAPDSVASGEVVPIDVVALGYPTVNTLEPVPHATVEATWDPETVRAPDGPVLKAADMPVVTTTANGEGRATLLLPAPKGPARSLSALITVRANGKERQRTVRISRGTAQSFTLFVSDSRVVPGSEVVAWTLWSSKDGSSPVAKQPVEFVLTQGGVVRFRREATTDPAGAAMMRVPIPRDDEPAGRWTLTAHASTTSAAAADNNADLTTSVELVTREERPGTPKLWTSFDEERVVVGAKAKYEVVVRDASGEPIAGHSVWVWSGPRGTEPPEDIGLYKAASTKLETDVNGRIEANVTAPSTVPLRGTELSLHVRTEIEGLPRQAEANIAVGPRRAYVTLTPEGSSLIPGVEQRVIAQLSGDDGKPVVGSFLASGDGLDASFTTNEHGEGEFSWKAPRGVGAFRGTGPCSGQVAAQVTLRAKDPSAQAGVLVDRAGMALCVPVDRTGTMFVRPAKLVVREGEVVPISVIGAEKKPASIVVTPLSGAQATSHWAADAGKTEIVVPSGTSGIVTLNVATPSKDTNSETAATNLLVLPTQLPKIAGKLTGGRAAPGGTVTVSAQLTDEKGAPMVGSVAAVMIDKFGGGSLRPLLAMDTRAQLCGKLGAQPDRCDAALFGGSEMDLLRRPNLIAWKDELPVSWDPATALRTQSEGLFEQGVRAIEQAVFDASGSLETLADVRSKQNGKFTFHPDLVAKLTGTDGGALQTPGGEALTLADLTAIDPQVTFDTAARRVTRVKLLKILAAVRLARVDLDTDDPLLVDPNLLVRKMVREGALADRDLLDPWGGQLSFIEVGGDYVPFLSVRKGWELRAPGPDGRSGTADDVKSPFERVLKASTPYAKATAEEEVVDARRDMLVADGTVAAWLATLLKATGTRLGSSEWGSGQGIGDAYGAGGLGFGSGHGSLGGRHTTSVPKGVAFVAPPTRTDAEGRVTFEIPLGDIETTWSVAFVGLPDSGRPAVNTLDIPISVPLSAKVQAGVSWTDGDRGEALVHVRNRTDSDLDVALTFSARGALALGSGAPSNVKVKRHGVELVRVPLRAQGTGAGFVDVRVAAANQPEDKLTHEVEVRPRGELIRIARTMWIDLDGDLGPALERPPFVAQGAAELVLERGDVAALESALESLDPNGILALEELADMADAAENLHRYFASQRGDQSALALRAEGVGRSATGKLLSLVERGHPLANVWGARALRTPFVDLRSLPNVPACPDDATGFPAARLGVLLDAEPEPVGGGVRDCWTLLAARMANELSEKDVSLPALARGVLAAAQRPHRAKELATMRAKLLAITAPDERGTISVPAGTSRSDRAMAYAALLASSDPAEDPARRGRMIAWLLVQRDARGSFGSVGATRAAVQALVREAEHRQGPNVDLRVSIDFGGAARVVTLKPGGKERLSVPLTATKVVVSLPEGGNLVARLERTYLRSYDVAPAPSESPIELEIGWPTAPLCDAERSVKNACASTLTAGSVGALTVAVRGGIGPSSTVDIRIPLPPGVLLAEPTADVRQLQGALYIRAGISSLGSLSIPLRFTFAGKFTAREATARQRELDAEKVIARARPVTVNP